MKAKNSQESGWPIWVKAPKNPNVAVKVYPVKQTNKRGEDGKPVKYTVYCLDWTVNGDRKRRYHADLEDAKKDAETVAGDLAGHSPDMADLKPEVRFQIVTAMGQLRKAGIDKPLAAVIDEYIRSYLRLGGIGSLFEAAADYADRNTDLRQIRIPDAVKEWIDGEENNKAGRERTAWADKLRKNVQKRFAVDFTGSVTALDPLAIDTWFSNLKNIQKGPRKGKPLSETTKRNIRDDLASFFRWCQSHRYLPKDAELLEAVPEFQRRSQRSKGTIRPDDLQKLFNNCPDYLQAYLAVRALAGVRESEANLLDWRNVHLDTGWIEITQEIAKQTGDGEGVAREVPIQPALKAWLASHAKAEGPICTLSDPLQAIPRLARKAGVALPANGLRHSYITYRCAMLNDVPRVADECGNSPAVIRKYYRKRGGQVREDAPKWFEIYPKAAEGNIIPHPATATG